MKEKKIRVLALDGGGMRGLIPAIVMEYVEQQLIEKSGNKNARLADYFDLMAGTSTGGILSCFYLMPGNDKKGVSSKYTASQAVEFYSEKGYAIFNASERSSWAGLRKLFNATAHSPRTIEKIFEEEFADAKLGELLKPCMITTYNLKTKSSFFFSSVESESKQREFYVRDVVRSTSAAPTYFPPAGIRNLKTGEQMLNIDGGVFANNPAMCAYAECRTQRFPQIDGYPTAKDMLILSVGTGGGQFDLPPLEKSSSWGALNWATSMPNIMIDGAIDTVNFQMNEMYKTLEKEHRGNYRRIDVPKDEKVRTYSDNMADASPDNIEKLKRAALITLEKAREEGLDEYIDLLIDNAPEPGMA